MSSTSLTFSSYCKQYRFSPKDTISPTALAILHLPQDPEEKAAFLHPSIIYRPLNLGYVCVLSHVWLFVTPWTVAYQVPCPWDFSGKNTGVALSEKCNSKPQWGTITRQSGWLLSKSLQAINAGEGVEKREPSHCWWECKLVQSLWKTLWRFL